jgi:hypothetical protein
MTKAVREWARCCECGGEVWFDAWCDLSGEVAGGPYDSNKCSECEKEDGQYEIVSEDE